MKTIAPLTQRASWKSLEVHFEKIREVHLRDWFGQDPARGRVFGVEALGMYLDYSKNRIDQETLKHLFALADESGLRSAIEAMFRGDAINITENRAVLHTALRAPRDARVEVAGRNVIPDVYEVLDRMGGFCDRIRSGQWKGHAGKPIVNIINIGIGGSDLGPVMAYEALKSYSDRSLKFLFVSNVDGTDFSEAVEGLDPAETLFIVASKTFTTQETMTNAQTARDWLLQGLGAGQGGGLSSPPAPPPPHTAAAPHTPPPRPQWG
jgi:glucose-6-phosphate isomerase